MYAQVLRSAASLVIAFTLLLGVAYPFAVTGIARVAFPSQAEGSLVHENGRIVGSRLIGQSFSDPKYFWGRPSATAPKPYNGVASTGSNLGPLNPALLDQVRANVKLLRDADPGNTLPIPVDLVSASASGLDPEISMAAALYQVPRVARMRHLSAAQVEALVRAHQLGSLIGFIGEPRVNVLELNLALDPAR